MKCILPHLLAPVLVLALSAGCEMPKLPAVGNEDEIIVFADDSAWQMLETTLRETFEDTVMTPQPERWFTLVREPFANYARFEKQKNRLVVGTLDSRDPVSAFVRQSLDSTVRGLVKEGKEFVFNKYDTKARNQIFMLLAGPDLPRLQASIRGRSQDLLYFFKSVLLRRELSALYGGSGYHKEEIAQRLMLEYDWSMVIQHDYIVARESAEDRFFWMRRATPADMERWIFVHWEPAPSAALLTEEWLLERRNRLTEKFLRTMEDDAYVEIAPYHLEITTVDFKGRFAYEARGNWRFSDKSGGGPFVNYTLYDEPSGRIYMLDGSIFAPRVEKKKLILQVDALLNTFRTFRDLSPDDQRRVLKEREAR